MLGRDTSEDNLVIYDDGHGYCFACEYFIPEGPEPVPSTARTTRMGHRAISRETMDFFGVDVRLDNMGRPSDVVFPYGPEFRIVRGFDTKVFRSEGRSDSRELFGQSKFNSGSGRAITITEGAYDAMACYEVLGKYPVVSVRSASTARSDCERAHRYLNSFDKVYLCFDSDAPGQDAAKEVAQLFDVNKVYYVQLDKHKDANDFLVKGDAAALKSAWWNARPFMPKNILSDFGTIEKLVRTEEAQSVATYPFPTLDSMAYGIRSGELVLLTALEKVGKTEVLRAIEYHLLKTTDFNIGLIHLEEKEKRSVQGLAGYELGVPAHLPDAGVSADDVVEAYKRLVKRDNRLHFYTHFGSDDPNSILTSIRYLVTVCHCKFIFLDHLTMLVSGFEDEDERRKLDFLSTRLAMLTRELDFTLFLVSHVNDDGKTRGSRMPAKVCDLHVYLSRDKESADPEIRCRTNVMVRDNRFGSATGPGGILTFDRKTFRLEEVRVPQEIEYDAKF